MRRFLSFAVIVSMMMAGTACKKETQPAEENDNELITTIQLQFTQRGTGDVSTFIWEDADGPGGDLPIMDTIRLNNNQQYDVLVTLWNKSVTPAEDITAEVKAESANHRVYYEPSVGSGVTIGDFDNGIDGTPLGVASAWTTTLPASGTVAVVLRHYPDGGKAADDPINSPKSSTDAGAIFEVKIGD